jgi:hypothetical protein
MAVTPVCIAAFDMTMDGDEELIVGWSDGTVEVRTNRVGGGGEVVARDKFGAAIAGIVVADYRLDGTNALLVVSAVGEVRGYLPFPVKVQPPTTPAADVEHENRKRAPARVGRGSGGDGGAGLASLVEKMRELERRKRDLLAELGAASTPASSSSASRPSKSAPALLASVDPQLSISLSVFGGAEGEGAHLVMTLSLGAADAAIAMVLMTSEDGLFKDDINVAYVVPLTALHTCRCLLADGKVGVLVNRWMDEWVGYGCGGCF